MGTQNFLKSQFLQFSCFVKSFKKNSLFFENFPPEALLPPSGGCWEIRSKNPESQRSPEGLLDAKGGFEDESSYPKLKFGGRKSTFQCLLKSNGPKTCSYRSATCFAAIPHIPNKFFSIQVNQNSSKIEFGKMSTGIGQKC